MKKILLSLCVIIYAYGLMAQGCVREISTNPENPVNEEWDNLFPGSRQSFLNSFNWADPVTIDGSLHWDSKLGNGPIPMSNPYTNSGGKATEFIWYGANFNINNSDWHWEDGWELLYLNLGFLPNGDPILNKPSDSWNPDP